MSATCCIAPLLSRLFSTVEVFLWSSARVGLCCTAPAGGAWANAPLCHGVCLTSLTSDAFQQRGCELKQVLNSNGFDHICTYTYICAFIYRHSTHTYIHTYIHTWTTTSIHTYVYKCMQMLSHVHFSIWSCSSVIRKFEGHLAFVIISTHDHQADFSAPLLQNCQ